MPPIRGLAGKVMDTWLAIGSEHLSAEVDPVGAQLSRLRDSAGRDLLWNGDPSVWNGRAPILFPIVGSLAGGRYRLGAKTYPLSRHGFARGRLFEVLDATTSAAAFRLQADEASRQVYPFDFALDVHFELKGPALAVTASVRNRGKEAMPASFGFHPALRWPLPYGRARSAHFIEFPIDEPAPIRRLNEDGLLSPTPHITPVSRRRLALQDALFQEDAIIFDQIRSTSVTYGADDGPRIRVSYPDTPYLGIWSKPTGNFICVEPWHGVADPEGFSGDFKAKPGVFMVPAGAATPIKMQIELIES
jgi:galactose mutarotase-like enzyme